MEEPVALNVEAGKENEQTLANLSPAEEAASKDEVEIEKFLQAQKSKNTQYKTKSDLNAWKKFCESMKETRAIENIPANELDLLLSKFFISVRKQDGTEYEPCTLSGFQRSFQRHLHEKGSLINILKDNEFSKSREVLAAKRKNLVRQGKGNRPNATRELTKAEEDALFENGQFGVQDPNSLQRALWWFVSLHFGWRARDESRKLCWGDVGLANDPETDSEYLVWKSERGSKTRTGKDGGHQRAFEPKAYASKNKSRCPVEFYKAFRSHRSEAMLDPSAPFYLAINHRRKPSDKVWYLDRPHPSLYELQDLSWKIIDVWTWLGRRLNFEDNELTAIDNDNKETVEKAYAILRKWKEGEGRDGTYLVLYKALCHDHVRRGDLAQEFCCQV